LFVFVQEINKYPYFDVSDIRNKDETRVSIM